MKELNKAVSRPTYVRDGVNSSAPANFTLPKPAPVPAPAPVKNSSNDK
jgi:hypothetical protein